MADRIQRLREAAQARHDDTLHCAETALRSRARRGGPFTVRGVADAEHVTLLALPTAATARRNRALRQPRSNYKSSVPANQRATIESLRQQLHAYREVISQLRAQINDFSEQLAHHLGATRTADRRPR